MLSSWHVATAAEAIAAAQFARCGWNVSVQYGANQPEFDLQVADAMDRQLKISVKGNKDGSWGLTQKYLSKANYHEAIETWLARHSKKRQFFVLFNLRQSHTRNYLAFIWRSLTIFHIGYMRLQPEEETQSYTSDTNGLAV